MACGCSSTNTCTSCGNSPCQCQQTVKASPSPYYNQAGCIQETHCQSITQQVFVTALSVSSDFIIPACNVTAVINFPGLASILIGGYLWNPTYGYLKVVGFDYLTGEVTVLNDCQTNPVGANAGLVVPRCTLFNVVDAPCDVACI